MINKQLGSYSYKNKLYRHVLVYLCKKTRCINFTLNLRMHNTINNYISIFYYKL